MAYKLFLVGVDNVLQSSVPVCYLLAADLEIKMLNFERWSRPDRVRCRVNGTNYKLDIIDVAYIHEFTRSKK